MHKTFRTATALLVATTCAFGATAVTASAAPSTAASTSTTASTTAATLSPQAKAAIAKLRAALPKDHAARLKANLARLGVDSEWLDLVNAVTSGETCTTPPALDEFIDKSLDGVNFEIMDAIGMAGGFSMPFVDAFTGGVGGGPQTFGPNGEFTIPVTHTFRDLQGFWDIASKDIELDAVHGRDVFADPARAARAISFMYGITPEEAQPIADQIITLLGEEPLLKGGAHPLFTFNAVALPPFDVPDGEGEDLPPAIMMGDGILEAMYGIGLGDAAVKDILAHEYGHQVQYADGLDDPTQEPTVEGLRRIELMADAFSSYFLAHARGQAMNTQRILDATTAAYNVGDCATTQLGHHGTPDQRRATAQWAADLANAARPQGKIMPSLDFVAKFDAALPGLLEN